jgi:Phage tail tube protein
MPAIPTAGGVVNFWAAGRQLRLSSDFKARPNKFQWESVAGQDGVHGRKLVPVIPTVATNISADGTLSLQQLAAIRMDGDR